MFEFSRFEAHFVMGSFGNIMMYYYIIQLSDITIVREENYDDYMKSVK